MQHVLSLHSDRNSSDYRLLSRYIWELTYNPESVTQSYFICHRDRG